MWCKKVQRRKCKELDAGVVCVCQWENMNAAWGSVPVFIVVCGMRVRWCCFGGGDSSSIRSWKADPAEDAGRCNAASGGAPSAAAPKSWQNVSSRVMKLD